MVVCCKVFGMIGRERERETRLDPRDIPLHVAIIMIVKLEFIYRCPICRELDRLVPWMKTVYRERRGRHY